MSVSEKPNSERQEGLRENEARLRELFDQAPVGYHELDTEGRITRVNRTELEMLGYTQQEMLGRPAWEFVVEAEASRRAIEAKMAGTAPPDQALQRTLRRKDGTTLPVLIEDRLLWDEQGGIAGIRSTIQDITARARAEDLVCIQRDLGIALGSTSDLTEVLDLLLEAACRIEGIDCGGVYLRDTRTGELNLASHRGLSDRFVALASHFGADSPHARLVEAGKSTHGLYSEVSPDKEDDRQTEGLRALIIVPVQYRRKVVACLNLASRTHDEIPASTRDAIQAIAAQIGGVVARVSAEEASRVREEAIRAFVETSRDWIWSIDREGVHTYCNPAVEAILGYRADELIGTSSLDLMHDDDRRAVEAGLPRWIAEKRGWSNLLVRWRHKDGTYRYLEGSAVPILNAERELIGFRGVDRDTTDRKRAEEALRQSEERFRSLARNSSDVISILAADGTATYQSLSIQRILGYGPETLIGKDAFGYIHPDDVARAREAFAEVLQHPDAVVSVEHRFRHADGSWVYVESVASNFLEDPTIGGVVVNSRDITERKRAEEEHRQLEVQIRNAQKLESLGVLAGGLAHDFNNLLVGILGNASLALMDLPEDSPARYSLEQIEKAALRTSELTGQMLAYSGRGKFVVQPTSLSALVEEMGHLLESAISKRAVLNYDFARDLPAIDADATQIRQVVMNLITNASEAIGDESGVIAVTTSAVHVDRSYPAPTFLSENLADGRYVCLEVSDTGCGMDTETQAKIFDPFFTTKFAGRGLGLAALLGIVRGHGGAVNVRSEVGNGTTFRILFPASEMSLEHGEQARAQEAPSSGHGLVLVVDDEANVRSVARACLERGGFSVLTAASGQEGVDIYKERADEIALVLLDMTMPDMDGQEALGEFRRIRGDVTVVLSSGFSEQEVSGRLAGRKPAGFIQKPYSASALLTKMRELLA